MPVSIDGSDFIALQVRDLQAAGEFCEKNLGLTRTSAPARSSSTPSSSPSPYVTRYPALTWAPATPASVSPCDSLHSRRPGLPRAVDRQQRQEHHPDHGQPFGPIGVMITWLGKDWTG
jgi:hypothetical protein